LLITSKWAFKDDAPNIDLIIPSLNTSHQSINALQSVNESDKFIHPIELCEKIMYKTSKELLWQKKPKANSPA